MLLTPHAILGVAIGASITNPYLAVPLSFGMHFIGDLVPHWDYYSELSSEERKDSPYAMAVMADLALGIGIGMFFTLYALWVLHNPALALNIFLCGIANVLPDALMAPSMLTPKKSNIISEVVHKFQHKMHVQIKFPWGFISQIIVSFFCLLVIASSLKLL